MLAVNRLCSIEECQSKHDAKGLCKKHYDSKYSPARRLASRDKKILYDLKNKNKKAEYDRAYNLINAEIVAKKKALYKKEHPEKVREYGNKRRARKFEAGVFKILKKEQYRLDNGPCFICQKPQSKDRRHHIDHIIPISRGGGHRVGNLRTLCSNCNNGVGGKFNMLDSEWKLKKMKGKNNENNIFG